MKVCSKPITITVKGVPEKKRPSLEWLIPAVTIASAGLVAMKKKKS